MLKLRLPKLVALGTFALGVFSTAYADITPLRTGPVSQYGQLMAGKNAQNEGRIYGSCEAYSTSGNEVQVKGMSLFWSQDPAYNRYWKNDVITGEVSRQGIQIIRAAMAVDLQRWGDGHYFMNGKTEYYQDLLDEAVQAAIENDIYVIIDYHSHIAAENVNRAKEFFKIQAKKWGAYDNVIFEIFNEPLCKPGHGAWADISGKMCNEYGGMITWSEIKAYAEEVIPIIRRYSDNLIVVGTPQWSARPGDVVGSAIDDPNVAYTLHFYAGYTDEGATSGYNTTNADNAISHGLSVFVTEWGTIGYDGGGTIGDPVNHSDAQNVSWQTWMNANKLSSANWNLGYNDTPNGETAAEYFTVNFDADDPATATWTYSASGQWVNANVFAGLTAINYTQCASYVDLPDIITGNDGPDGEFGDVYEDEVINHDYVIVDFDMNNLGGGNYFYVYSSLDDPKGDWTWTMGNAGESSFFVDGSNAGGLVEVNANGGSGWAGFGIYLKEMKGCEVLSFKYKGLANDFSFNVAGGSALIQESLSSTESWMTWSISLDGIDPTVLESPIELKWQVSGSPDGEDLYIDDVVCGDPASGSNDPLVPPYMIDDFDGNQVGDEIYVYQYNGGIIGNPVVGEAPDQYYEIFFSGEGFGSNVAGLENVTTVTSPDWQGVLLEKVVPGLAGCSWISYRYRGSRHQFRVRMPSVADGNYHSLYVEGSDEWKTAAIDVSRLEQGDWGEGTVYVNLDMSQVEKINWELNGDVTGAELYIDDVQCLTEKPPVGNLEFLVDDFEGNGYAGWQMNGYSYLFVDEPWTVANEWYHPDWSEDPNYQERYKTTDDPEKGTVGALLNVVSADEGNAGLGDHVRQLEGCAVLQYKYKGLAHTLAFMNRNDTAGTTNYMEVEEFGGVDVWTTVTYDMYGAVAGGLDLSSELDIQWRVIGPADGESLLIDDVECVIPAEIPPVEPYEFLVSDFDGNGTMMYPYVYRYDASSIGNAWDATCDDGNGCNVVVLQNAAYTGDYGAALVGISSTAPTSSDPGQGAAVLAVRVPNLEGCKTLKYAYKGAGHTVLLRYNENDNYTYEVDDASARTEWGVKMVSVAGYGSPEEITDIRFRVLGQPDPNYLYVDDVECVLEEPAVELPEPKAPTTYTALVDDFEDGDNYPLWPVGNWWIDYAGPKTGTSMTTVKGSQSSKALQVSFILDGSNIDFDPYAAISSNNFDDLNLSNCTEVRYDYKGAAHKFRIKFSGQINDRLNLDWNFHAFAVESRSESWQTVSIPLSSLRQQYCDENECYWGSYIPLDTIMKRVDGFDWRVDGADGLVDSLAIDNIRCVGLGETPYYTVTFKNGDGSTMETQTWAENSYLYFPDLAPTKEPTAQYEFFFTGWNPSLVDEHYEPVRVTADTVYIPEFTENLRYYEITFLTDDDDLIWSDTYAYGTRVASFSPSAPAKVADDSCTYAFAGWDPSFDSETIVEGAVTYKATYEPTMKTFDIVFMNGEDTIAVVSEVYGTLAGDINVPGAGIIPEVQGKKFAGWDPGLARVTGEAVYTALYTDKYVVTWKDYNGNVLWTDFLDEGETPDYGAAPARAATAEYTYTFKGWSPAVAEVTDDAIYTATYDSTKNKYDVVFYDEDGTPLEALTDGPYVYGTLVSSIAPTPTKAATAEYTYTFAGWSPAITNATAVTDDAIYTAVYTETVNTYTITFVLDDGTTEYATVTRDYGTEISTMLPKVDPVKAADAQYTYEFEKWVAEDGSDVDMETWLEADMTLKAKFSQFVRKYTVTFLNYNSDVLKSGLYEYGTEASVIMPDENPTRPDDGSYRYTFDGWDSEVTNVTGAAVYTATYTSTVHVQYAAVTVEEVDGKLAASIDGAFDDPNGVNIPNAIEVDTVIFNRTFSASGYSTIMLPFSINRSAIEGVSRVLTFSGIGLDSTGKKRVEMEEVNGELSAYKPYMVELNSEGSLVFHGNSIEIQPTEGANTAVRSEDGWEFRGTLSKIVWDEKHPDLGRVYGFSGKETDKVKVGQFVKAAAGAWITPFRAYMIYDPDGNSAGKSTGYAYVGAEPLPDYMDVVVVNRSATGEESKTVIGGLNTRTGEFKMLQNYDLKGRKLNGKPTARGVYYGKKKIIK